MMTIDSANILKEYSSRLHEIARREHSPFIAGEIREIADALWAETKDVTTWESIHDAA